MWVPSPRSCNRHGGCGSFAEMVSSALWKASGHQGDAIIAGPMRVHQTQWSQEGQISNRVTETSRDFVDMGNTWAHADTCRGFDLVVPQTVADTCNDKVFYTLGRLSVQPTRSLSST